MSNQPQSLTEYAAACRAVALDKFGINYGGSGDECWRAAMDDGRTPEQAVAEDLSNA